MMNNYIKLPNFFINSYFLRINLLIELVAL